MTWLKLTLVDDSKQLINMDNVLSVSQVTNRTYVTVINNDYRIVKESLEEIEAMLNKNEQSQKLEITSNDLKRDYIGSDGAYKIVRDV